MIKKLLLWVALPAAVVTVYLLLSYRQPYVLVDAGKAERYQKHTLQLSSDHTDHGGKTSIDTLSNTSSNLTFTYTLRKGHLFQYANAMYMMDSTADLSAYDVMTVTVKSSQGKLSQVGICDYQTIKDSVQQVLYIQVVDTSPLMQTMDLQLSSFYIPEWWFLTHPYKRSDYPPVSFDQVRAVFFSNALNVPMEQEDRIEIRQWNFHQSIYKLLLPVTVFLTCYYLLGAGILFFQKRKNKRAIRFEAKSWSPEDFRSKEEAALFTYLTQHYVEDPSMSDLAKQSGLSEKTIAVLIKEKTGLSFKQFHTQLRLTEAKRLLKESDLQVAEIAFKVGFGNVSHFNRVFKTEEQCSPNEYRKSGKTN